MKVRLADVASLPEETLRDFSFGVHEPLVERFEKRLVAPVVPPCGKRHRFIQDELVEYINPDAGLLVAYDGGAPVAYAAIDPQRGRHHQRIS
ncbi:hypothetical protein [Sinorhizobium medicae]